MGNTDYGQMTRVGKKMRKILNETKSKNNLGSITEAGETLADIFSGLQRKKKIKEKIIRELEF